jgi:hypothetical protein
MQMCQQCPRVIGSHTLANRLSHLLDLAPHLFHGGILLAVHRDGSGGNQQTVARLKLPNPLNEGPVG